MVVWDVDLVDDDVIKVYRYTDPETPITYHRGDIAEAEPAVPGWTMPVDDLLQVTTHELARYAADPRWR
jgi:hypothetical protein